MTEKSCRIRGVEVLAVDDAVVELVERASGLSTIVARVLAARGVNSQDAVERFLSPSLERDWLDPLGIPGMGEAAQRVAAAIEGRERICVFGDFDLDGISSSALAARGLAELGADVVPLVPHRFDEGYGLSAPAIERMMRTISPRLVVTVDTGISSREEIAALNTAGVDVVVTDHHEPGDLTPLSIPMTNPKLDPACPSQSLSGAGVALKLVHAVGLELGRPDVWRSLTDLAALGTIADIVPLVGENRALVADGIRRLNADPRVSLAALANVAGLAPGSIDGEGVAYGLSPRLNAAGRMADPAVALELLMTDDEETARTLATALDEYNRLRQSVEADLTAAALEQAKGELAKGRPGLVLAGEGWHEGVKGIVASRLASMYGLPTMLFSVENGEARGSGRSVGTVDLFQTTSACADLLTRFGGHAAAVGLTLPAADLPLFAERFCDILGTLPEERFVSSKAVDALLPLSAVSVELGVELERLAPFGHSNPRPRFVVPGVFMTSRQRVGRANDHLRFTAYDGSVSIPAIAFKCKDIERLSEHDAAVDLVASLEVDEWRGRRRAQLLVSGLHELESPEDAPAAALVEDLFARADAILAREEYAGIEDATSFHTKLAGVTFEGRQEVLARLKAGTPLRIERQPDNVHDASACALFSPDGAQVGFFNRRLAAAFAPVLDAGVEYDVTVTDVTGGDTRDRAWGVNVLVERRGDAAEAAEEAEARAARRAQLSAMPARELDAALVRLFIGDRVLHDAQSHALAELSSGASVLAVMATGRGKSLIFQLHAARRALHAGSASVFVYPLRALVADQAFSLSERFVDAGLTVRVVTGESSPGERDKAFVSLEDGSLDVVLTTPEFLEAHAERFAASRRVGFVVVDEAHHVGQSRASHRPTYGRLGDVLERLGNPQVFATTATCSAEAAEACMRVLGVERTVLDPTVRENLALVDRRGASDRDGTLAALISNGDKTIVYVNSREQSVRIARDLRKRVPSLGMRIAFYNGGLTKSSRHAVERAFRGGDLTVVVSTSAFGEGVNIPDVRNVVLYHLPFNDVEFNQMCGRAGRDGQRSQVHLLFGAKDARINDLVLSSQAPERDDLAALYLALRDAQGQSAEPIEITNAELVERARSKRREFSLDERGVSAGIGIMRELEIVTSEGRGAYRRLSVPRANGVKVELDQSVRYAEGREEIAEFGEFRDWVLSAEPDELLARFNRPILPE